MKERCTIFFHGIPLVHLVKQAPVLSPQGKQKRKSFSSRADARRLVERLGFEPIHLLRSSPGFPISRCIRECLRYGDTVWAFREVGYPRVQLSQHEWGVTRLDLRQADWVLTVRRDALKRFRSLCPGVPVLVSSED